jgi:isopentenyl-diphosphate delta-isomerase
VSEPCLIRVNARDEVLGPESESRCHEGEGLLHRAFSVYLFDAEGRLLLQRRSRHKRLWPHYWSNSCCSHPRWGEETDAAAMRRVEEELGMRAELDRVCSFQYQATFGDEGAERELCAVYVGRTAGALRPRPAEIAECAFAAPAEVDARLREPDSPHTPWLRIAWPLLRGEHWHQIVT